jgi:hypothetical protein
VYGMDGCLYVAYVKDSGRCMCMYAKIAIHVCVYLRL